MDKKWVKDEQQRDIFFVVSLNLHRRHLDASQLGMVGARVREIFEDDARKRMTTGTNQYSPSIKRCEGNKGRSSVKAAELVGSSQASVERGTKVLKEGVEELRNLNTFSNHCQLAQSY